MDEFTFWNFIAGPLGCSFGIIKERGHLFSEKNFKELSSDALKNYNELSNSQEKKMFTIGMSEEDHAVEIVTELEKMSLIHASKTIKKFVKEMDPNLRDEKAIIDIFASKFNFLTDNKTEPVIIK